jgi:hypothetical protein
MKDVIEVTKDVLLIGLAAFEACVLIAVAYASAILIAVAYHWMRSKCS